MSQPMSTANQLYQQLLQLDRRGYKAYKQIQGTYQFPQFVLAIDTVQSDPFAAPSRMRVMVPQAVAQMPEALYRSPSRAVALRDYLARQFAQVAAALRERRGSGNSGLIAIDPPSQAIIARSSLLLDANFVEARFRVGLPAHGRQIWGPAAAALLCEDLPQIIERALQFQSIDRTAVQQHVEAAEDADWLRQQLSRCGLVAFIPDGAILPRCSGISDQPLSAALPFRSPDGLRVTFDRPNLGSITGMGVPKGITLIVGGGFHGKSTLLQAIALGIYNHVPGDGREQVVTDPAAVKIRAEDGRSITGVNLSPFINHLPQGRSTTHFSTPNASGSTSQAANILEALEVGATTLLIDEDTSATNLMIRDRRMQALISPAKEPITPFIDKVRQLYADHGVSTILVMGGSGDYFDVADTVIAMTDFQPQDVTAQAKAIAQQYPTDRLPQGGSFAWSARVPRPQPLDRDGRSPKLKVRGLDELVYGDEAIDLSAVEQIVEMGQLRAIGAAIAYAQQHEIDGQQTIAAVVERAIAGLKNEAWDRFTAVPQGDLSCCRPMELAAALNRLRSLEIEIH